MSQPPPQDTLWRCVNFPNFKIETGAGWEKVSAEGDTVIVDTPKGRMTFDYLICGTGISNDTHLRPELSSLAEHIATWNDVFLPPVGKGTLTSDMPRISPGFQFLEKKKGSAPILSRFTTSPTAQL